MARVTEIAPDVFQICTYVKAARLQFHRFLIRDEQPMLIHTGLRGLFDDTRDAVATLIDPAELRYVALSHVEADECGCLGAIQQIAPQAEGLCSLVAKVVSVDDAFAVRPVRALADGEQFSTGRMRFRFLKTPHVPHAWDAGLLFEESAGTLFCSDLFHQGGDVEAVTSDDVLGRVRQTLEEYQAGPLADYMPLSNHTQRTLDRLADLAPRTLATMHGSAYVGDGRSAINGLAACLRDVLGR